MRRQRPSSISMTLLLLFIVLFDGLHLLATLADARSRSRSTTNSREHGYRGGRYGGKVVMEGKSSRAMARRARHGAVRPSRGGGAAAVGGGGGGGGGSTPYKVFDVLSYGAVGDGEADDTKAFLSAWQEACQVESALFEVPQFFTFVVRPIVFSGPCASNIVFKIDGNIVAPENPAQWGFSSPKGSLQWMDFVKLHDMLITGSGVVNGNGALWWSGFTASKGQQYATRPAAMRFYGSRNISVEGIRLINSPQTHLKFDNCVGVSVEKVTVISPSNSPNTDGIHLQNTVNAHVRSAQITNGDDCISIQTGSSNLDIHDILCDGGHGISLGGLGRLQTQACVSNVTVHSVTIKNSQNGVRIKTWQGGIGTVKGIEFKDVTVENIINPIIIDQYYCDTQGSGKCQNMSSAVRVAGVTYHNIRGTYTRGSPIHFACSDTVPCSGIVVSQIELLPSRGFFVDKPFCWNTYGSSEMPTVPPLDELCLHSGPTPKNSPSSQQQSSSSSLDDVCAS